MAQKFLDSFGAPTTVKVGNQSYKIYHLDRLDKAGFISNIMPNPSFPHGLALRAH